MIKRVVCRGVFSRRCRFSSSIPRDDTPYTDRSAVTRLLWDHRSKQGRGSGQISPPVDKSPADSYLELVLPFSTDSVLREQYLSPFGHIRIGRLLEDLDAFAGNIAFAHVAPSTPTLVTASVDKLDLIPKFIDPYHDLKICGNVTSVGTSSMEIRIDAFQGPDWPTILTTYFYFVARDPVTNKATPINRLVPQTEKDRERMERGERNKEERLAAKKQSLSVGLPSAEEMEIVHRFFMADQAMEEKRSSTQSSGVVLVPMASTHQRSLIFCAHQQRNIHNKIFGGYLMRKAFELGFTTAYLFAGRPPAFSALGDITFGNSVAIGAILDLRSAVVYTSGNDIQVHVTARVHDPKERTTIKTNDFAFSFDLYDKNENNVDCMRNVQPKTYSEAMSYLEGRRSFLRHRKVE